MKNLKILLTAYIVIHFSAVLIVNLIALTKFVRTGDRLNEFGTSIVKHIEKPGFIEHAEDLIGLYVNITGVNRGYEFFSPNVYSGSIKLSFETESGENLKLFKSIESQMKFFTFALYFNANIQDKEKRDDIMKSVCLRLFSKNTDLNQVNIYADVQMYRGLQIAIPEEYVDDKGKILLSKITKNDHEKNS